MNNHFAEYYEALTYDVPFELWVDIIEHYGQGKQSVLDIGMGTGRILNALSFNEKYGFDISKNMVEVAMGQPSLHKAHLTHMSMLDFLYNRKFDCVIATSDVLNYLSNIEEVLSVINRVYDHLNDDGIFIFDIHSEHKMMTDFNDQTYADDTDDISLIWFCHSGETSLSVEHELIMFVKNEDGTYHKKEETLYQRTYAHKDMLKTISDSKFDQVHAFSDFDINNPVVEECERVFYILKK